MKILMINVSCGTGSTGRICADIAKELTREGHIVKIAYGRGNVPSDIKSYAIRVGNQKDIYAHVASTRLFDKMGFQSRRATKGLLKWIDQFKPDLIHLHNIHGYFLNVELLFEYIKMHNIPVIWTLHDCWSFTGHCMYFDIVQCEKWREHCMRCPQKDEYPERWLFDRSFKNYEKKKRLFTNVSNIILVTPSQWLANLVQDSFLGAYKIVVINNGIDIGLFQRTKSELREKMGLTNKRIILGVSSVWDKRKGINVFCELSKRLDDSYTIILVGVDDRLKQDLPTNIISISRTESIHQLAQYYSMADVFINPTYEDNYPTTNLEAIACGTPVITFDTGGSPESASLYGTIVPRDDYNALIKAIDAKYDYNINREEISYKKTVLQYIELYESICGKIKK